MYYRGDETANRIWEVINVGDKYIKIETEVPSINGADTLKIVTADDIYKADLSFIPNTPPEPYTSANPLPSPPQNGGNYNQSGNGLVPHITVAPVIKVMNGGSDFSTGQEGEQPARTDNIQEPLTVADIGGGSAQNADTVQTGGNAVLETSSGGDSEGGSIDFSKLQIRKIQ